MIPAEPFRPGSIPPEVRAFNAELEATLARLPATHTVDPKLTRKVRAEGRGIFPNQLPHPDCRWEEVGAAPGGPGRARVAEPEGKPRGTYLHIHGGGWTIGAPDQSDRRNLALARATGLRVVSVQYRLAPEHPWPACADDCEAAAVDLAGRKGPLFIGGESAGAHLAVVTLLRLRERGLGGRFRAAVLNYGCFDLAMTPSMAAWGARNLILSTPMVEWFVANLVPDARRLGDPAISPLRARLDGLPAALFQIGTMDPLLDDSLFMAARWLAAGNRAELEVWPGAVHAFDSFETAQAAAADARKAAFLSGF